MNEHRYHRHILQYGLFAAVALTLCVASATSAHADSATAVKLAAEPGVSFAHELADVPGKNLAVVKLEFPARSPEQAKEPPRNIAHRHPGSTYVYVIKGTLLLGIEGQPVQVVHAGESFFEPVGAVHTVAENQSSSEPASAIAVLIVPDGAAILTPVDNHAH